MKFTSAAFLAPLIVAVTYAQDVTPPVISAKLPAVDEVITGSSYIFLADVTDDSGSLKSVRFMLRDPSGVKTPWEDGISIPTDVYEASFDLPQGGSWSYRIKAVDNSENAITTDWYDFFVTNTDTASTVALVRQEIENIIAASTVPLAPKFVRLGFHDCVPDENFNGGCDGCVDLSFGDNAGLDIPINALKPLVDQYASPAFGLSRADIWALAALVGADVSQSRDKVPFPMEYIGRVDCENAHTVCYKENGNEQPCQENRGPHRPLPGPDMTTSELLHWFSTRFGFDAKETTAIMGAHTIGAATRQNSGFDGEHGWVNNQVSFANGYYNLIVGDPDGRNDLISDFEGKMFAPAWTLEFIDNTDLGTPNRFQWFHQKDPNRDDADSIALDKIIMMNSDIALVRDLDGYIDEEGNVTQCQFRCLNNACATNRLPRCPHAAQMLDFVSEYRHDNIGWLTDFSAAFRKMLIKGYDVDVETCFSEQCTLTLQEASASRNLMKNEGQVDELVTDSGAKKNLRS